MPIVGTAGHVDHGKSTLVRALTGRDPDRWAEEKERGLTIDLGFAWTELTPGTTVGFVDVPGHERFMKNMLAGVGALDVALFVVAADEGWMPQSEEHLSVLDLLDVRHGVIALTRADLVDSDTLEIAELEISDKVAATVMEPWPIVAVSPVSNLGLDALREALISQLEAAGSPIDSGRPRMWVDRSFVISGAGVVVTGTLSGGALRTADTFALFPGGRTVRIRGLQSHEQEVDVARPGSRTAINLSGIERDLISRGTLLAKEGQIRPTRKFLADIRIVRSHDEALTGRGAFHLHLGSGTWPVKIAPTTPTGIIDRGAALIATRAEVPVAMGDRFILREVGRRAVIAGGIVLDPSPTGRLLDVAGHVASLQEAVADAPDAQAQALLDARGIALLDDLAADSGGGRPLRGAFSDSSAISERRAQLLMEDLEAAVREYQAANPLREGAPKASLPTRIGLPAELLDTLLAESDVLVDQGVSVRTTDFSGTLGPAEDRAWDSAAELLSTHGLSVPRASQLGLDQELLHSLVRSGRVIQVAQDLVYLPHQVDQIVESLSALGDEFTVAEFRDALGVSRRHAVPLLEWIDGEGWTSRSGNTRTVRKRPDSGESGAQPR